MARPADPRTPSRGGGLPSILFLFAASGAAGLIHEVAWARALGQSLGQSLQASSAVLAAFLGGLGLGAAIGSRSAGRLRSPLAAYAALEGLVGIYGACSPQLSGMVARLLEALGPEVGPGPMLAVLRLILALAVLLPPTIAMGATFPILVRERLSRGTLSRDAVALLYGANTLGGALGALLGSFALLPLLGTRRTFLCAAAINGIAGAIALRLGLPAPAAQAPPQDPPSKADAAGRSPGAAAPGPARIVLPVAAVLSGLCGALFQVGWTRVAALAFGSTVYALGLTLTVYILGLGIGPLLVRARLGGKGASAAPPAVALSVLGLSSLLLLPVLGRLPVFAARISGLLGDQPLVAIVAQFLFVGLLLLLPTLAQGATLPALVLMDRGREGIHGAAGRLYALSTWGSVLGFLLAGFVLLPAWGTRAALVAASLGALLVAAGLTTACAAREATAPRHRVPAAIAPAGALALAAAALLALLPSWDRSLVASGGFLYGPVYRAALGRNRVAEAMRRRGTILFEKDGGEGLVTVRRSAAGILSLQINGRTEASTGGDLGTQLLAGHLPLLLHPRPEAVMVIGLASGITLGAVERHPIREARVIEIAPAVVAAARLFETENRGALDDPRGRIVIDDARGFLLARSGTYDVITSQPSNPWVAGVSNLFTEEFDRLARRRLRPGGLFCQWVQAYRMAPDDLRGIVAAFLRVFPEATLWEESAGGGDYFLIGGDRPLAVDPEHLAGPEVAPAWNDLARAGISGPADLLARYVSGPRGLRAFAAGARPLTDDDLSLEWRAPLALFRDTLKEQAAAINRYRESPLAILRADLAARDPDLAAAIRQRERLRWRRLALLDSLRGADLWALWNPFMAAGIDLLRAGRFTEAAQALSRAVADDPDSAGAHLLLGEAYRASGLDAAAAIAFREAVDRDPSLAEAWNGLGVGLEAQGLVDAARAAFERALAADPGLAPARNNFGTILLRGGDLEGAARSFREALGADPSLAAARANLGLTMKLRGDLEGAEAEYRAALELDPLNDDARYNLDLVMRDLSGTRPGSRRGSEPASPSEPPKPP